MTLGAAAAARRRTTAVTPSAITIMGNGSTAVTGSRSPSVTFSGYTPQLNDVIVLFPTEGAANLTVTIPSGWVNPLGGTTSVASDNNTGLVLYHLVTSGEVSAVTTTYTLTNLWNNNAFGNVVGAVLRGVNTTTPVDSVNTAFDSSDTATPHTIPGLTGANLSTGSLVLACVSRDGAGAYAGGATGYTTISSTNLNYAKWFGRLDAATEAGVDVASASITPLAGDEFVAITIAFTAA